MRYQDALNSIPAPGAGCHPALLSVANLGVLAGLNPNQLHEEIRQNIPPGRRQIKDREIQDAIRKALSDHRGGTFIPRSRPQPAVRDGKAALQRIIEQASIETDVDLWEASPVRLLDEPRGDAALLLETLYRQDDLIWTGDRYQAGIIGDTIRTASDWISYFQSGAATAPHIILNPLTGTPATTKGGDKTTLRGDGNISSYRYCMAEFDDLTRDDQIRFWAAVRLPIICLIDSGGKSIHGILEAAKLATVATADQWQTEIKTRLYDQILKPLGVDGACSNPARLSRLPGHYRTEKKQMQKILWLSPEGRPVSC